MRELLETFTLIFLVALPGRTTFVLIALSGRASALRILTASLPAFILQCAVGVILGQLLKLVPHSIVELTAGLLFIYFARKFWHESQIETTGSKLVRGPTLLSIFSLIFVAEFGDVSQLAVAERAAQTSSAAVTFFGAASAMCALTVLAAFAGQALARQVRPSTLQRAAAALFLAFGLYLLIGSATIALQR